MKGGHFGQMYMSRGNKHEQDSSNFKTLLIKLMIAMWNWCQALLTPYHSILND